MQSTPLRIGAAHFKLTPEQALTASLARLLPTGCVRELGSTFCDWKREFDGDLDQGERLQQAHLRTGNPEP